MLGVFKEKRPSRRTYTKMIKYKFKKKKKVAEKDDDVNGEDNGFVDVDDNVDEEDEVDEEDDGDGEDEVDEEDDVDGEDEVDEADDIDEEDEVVVEDDVLEKGKRKKYFQNIVQVITTANNLIQVVTGKLASVMHGFSVFSFLPEYQIPKIGY